MPKRSRTEESSTSSDPEKMTQKQFNLYLLSKIESMDRKFESMDQRIASMDQRISKKLEKIEKRLDKAENINSRSAEFQASFEASRLCKDRFEIRIPENASPSQRIFEKNDVLFAKFRDLLKSKYEVLWTKHSGLKKSFNMNGIEFNVLGFGNRDESDNDQSIISPSDVNQPGDSGCFSTFASSKTEEQRLNCIIVFEVTTATVSFNDQSLPFTSELAASNLSTKVLLDKLLQLERQIEFLIMYYGCPVNSIVGGLSIYNRESLLDARETVSRALDSSFAECIPNTIKINQLKQFIVI